MEHTENAVSKQFLLFITVLNSDFIQRFLIKKQFFVVSAPPKLRNIRSTHALLRENVYSVNVTWDAPMQEPAYYIVNLTLYYRDEIHLNISGVSIHCFIVFIFIFRQCRFYKQNF